MGTDERRAVSKEMMDRIDAVLSGHELQRSPESGMYGDVAPVIDDGPLRFDDEARTSEWALSHSRSIRGWHQRIVQVRGTGEDVQDALRFDDGEIPTEPGTSGMQMIDGQQVWWSNDLRFDDRHPVIMVTDEGGVGLPEGTTISFRGRTYTPERPPMDLQSDSLTVELRADPEYDAADATWSPVGGIGYVYEVYDEIAPPLTDEQIDRLLRMRAAATDAAQAMRAASQAMRAAGDRLADCAMARIRAAILSHRRRHGPIPAKRSKHRYGR